MIEPSLEKEVPKKNKILNKLKQFLIKILYSHKFWIVIYLILFVICQAILPIIDIVQIVQNTTKNHYQNSSRYFKMVTPILILIAVLIKLSLLCRTLTFKEFIKTQLSFIIPYLFTSINIYLFYNICIELTYLAPRFQSTPLQESSLIQFSYGLFLITFILSLMSNSRQTSRLEYYVGISIICVTLGLETYSTLFTVQNYQQIIDTLQDEIRTQELLTARGQISAEKYLSYIDLNVVIIQILQIALDTSLVLIASLITQFITIIDILSRSMTNKQQNKQIIDTIKNQRMIVLNNQKIGQKSNLKENLIQKCSQNQNRRQLTQMNQLKIISKYRQNTMIQIPKHLQKYKNIKNQHSKSLHQEIQINYRFKHPKIPFKRQYERSNQNNSQNEANSQITNYNQSIIDSEFIKPIQNNKQLEQSKQIPQTVINILSVKRLLKIVKNKTTWKYVYLLLFIISMALFTAFSFTGGSSLNIQAAVFLIISVVIKLVLVIKNISCRDFLTTQIQFNIPYVSVIIVIYLNVYYHYIFVLQAQSNIAGLLNFKDTVFQSIQWFFITFICSLLTHQKNTSKLQYWIYTLSLSVNIGTYMGFVCAKILIFASQDSDFRKLMSFQNLLYFVELNTKDQYEYNVQELKASTSCIALKPILLLFVPLLITNYFVIMDFIARPIQAMENRQDLLKQIGVNDQLTQVQKSILTKPNLQQVYQIKKTPTINTYQQSYRRTEQLSKIQIKNTKRYTN